LCNSNFSNCFKVQSFNFGGHEKAQKQMAHKYLGVYTTVLLLAKMRRFAATVSDCNLYKSKRVLVVV
jgi:hypothetical protein